MTENEMSGEPYSLKSGWINHSNEPFFQVMTPSVHHIVISRISYCFRVNSFSLSLSFSYRSLPEALPKLKEIRKLFDGRC